MANKKIDQRAVEILRAAAARVRAGWCQGELKHGGDVCAVGAIRAVSGRHIRDLVIHARGPAYTALKLVAQMLHPTRRLDRRVGVNSAFIAVVNWNDAEEQTQENVALGLEYAALLAEERTDTCPTTRPTSPLSSTAPAP